MSDHDQSFAATEVQVVLPAVSDGQVSSDLVDLTEHLSKAEGAEISRGLLGGEFGYGAIFENETFAMHPFCWCGGSDCPWCWGCECPEGADVYEVRGNRVSFSDWAAEYDRIGSRDRSYWKDVSIQCDFCAGDRVAAPNFLHKPSGSQVSWYKYIGRSMELDLRESWSTIFADCMASLGGAP